MLDAPTPDEELIRQAKQALRARMRALRAALPASSLAARSERIVATLLGLREVEGARALAVFQAIPRKHEIQLSGLDAELRRRGKLVYYPFMDPTTDGYRTGFRRVDDPATLAERGRGFPEPQRDAPEARRGELDVVVVPALALSVAGQRIGWGAGWYDATLPDVRPPALAIGVALDFQLLGELPSTPRDVPVDYVVTDARASRVG
ncbi:MAG: 5-formyltetrahydrofolate cyclo-ligase [Polyangiaceae bacterium]|nr:5-formyltetrahydrofolate cyclo-ligase [Polyangiaceae bacterium]